MLLCVCLRMYILQMHELGVADDDFFKGIIKGIASQLLCYYHHYSVRYVAIKSANIQSIYRCGSFVVFDFTRFPQDE